MLQQLYNWYGKRTVLGAIALAILLIVIGLFFTLRATDTPEAVETKTKTVTLRTVSELSEGTSFAAVGVVTAVSEARLETESSGRVTSVSVGIGDRVSAGQILAQIENSRERAAVLQAEGAYEAALAGGTQSGISLADAKTSALNIYRNAFTAADDTIRNLTDELFSNPTTLSVGLRLDGQGQATRLNAERIAFGGILTDWSNSVSAGDTIDVKNALDTAEADLLRIGTFVSDLSMLLAEQDEDSEFTADVVAAYKVRLSAARSRIDASVQSVTSARNTLLQAEQAASGAVANSETDARIKQALGNLRGAQSAYEKTIIRTPISGVVNAFYLTANQYVGQATPAAIIANNNALEIKTSIGEQDRDAIRIGDVVRLNDTATGTITRIAPAIDPTTGKIEVRIGVADGSTLRSGDTVSLRFTRSTTAEASGILSLPIAAFKITAEGPVAFGVSTDNTLVAYNVVLGAIAGDSVIVKEGLTSDMRIVTDARGLKAGELVNVIGN